MICITCHDTLATLVIRPCNRFPVAGEFVCYRVVVHNLANTVYVGTAAKLVPFIIGQAVSVVILADHDDSGFRAAGISQTGTDKRIAHDVQVILTGNIYDRVIKSECHVTPETAKANHPLILNKLHTFLRHCIGIITFLPLGHCVDKLPRSRYILVHFIYIRRVLTLRTGSRYHNEGQHCKSQQIVSKSLHSTT